MAPRGAVVDLDQHAQARGAQELDFGQVDHHARWRRVQVGMQRLRHHIARGHVDLPGHGNHDDGMRQRHTDSDVLTRIETR
jgi:hypothetical protein